jgi:hypothetical protein
MSEGAITANDVGSTSAVVSLLTLVVSFFNDTHIWLQNCTLLVSLVAGIIAICIGIKGFFKKK